MNIRELASILGVSPATVSLALNNKKGVSEATRKRIREEAIRLHYIEPDLLGCFDILFLKYKKHGMLVEENAGFINSIIDSIEKHCRLIGYNLIISAAEGPHELDRQLRNISFNKYAGVIFLGTELSQMQYSLLEKIPVPYVVVDNPMFQFPCHVVCIDNKEMVFAALSYLKKIGHFEVSYFSSKLSIPNFVERKTAFYRGTRALGQKVRAEYKLGPTSITAYHDMLDYLDTGSKLNGAVFADNDSIAIGAMKAMQEFNIKIPKDVAIIGLDDIIYAKVNSPSLTTMRVFKEEIGSIAVRHLYQLITNGADPLQKIRVGGELIVRESTGGRFV